MFPIVPVLKAILCWQFHEYPLIRLPAMFLTNMYSPGKVEKYSCLQRVKWEVLQMIQNVPCAKSHLPWKIHGNPFSRYSVMLLKYKQTDKQTNKRTTVKHKLRRSAEVILVNFRWQILSAIVFILKDGIKFLSTINQSIKCAHILLASHGILIKT